MPEKKDFYAECAKARECIYAENKTKCENYAPGCIHPWCDYCSFYCEKKGN